MPNELIRLATIEDLPKLAPLAEEFYSSSAFLRDFNIGRFCALWQSLLQLGTGVIFVLEVDSEIVGVIGGMMHPEAYSDELLCQEFFWFVGQSHRGNGIRLYAELEKWARKQGCSEIRMGHLSDSMPDKMANFYKRLGYRQVEINFAKRLNEVEGLRRVS